MTRTRFVATLTLLILFLFSIRGIVKSCSKPKPPTRAEKIEVINNALKKPKYEIDSSINTLPDTDIDSLYEVKRAENQ